MTNIDALSDDLIHNIVSMLHAESAFVSLVCKRFRKANVLAHARFGHTVTPLRRVFASIGRLKEAMQSPSVLWRLCHKDSLVADGAALWNSFATRSAFSEGPVEVVCKVRPNWLDEKMNLHYICRYDRVDLLDQAVSSASGDLFEHVSDILSRMSTTHDKTFSSVVCRIEGEVTTKEFVESVVVPASIGGAMKVLLWFMHGIKMRQLRVSTLWNRAFDGVAPQRTACFVGKIACGAACAPNADEVLDFVVQQVVNATGYPRERVCQEVALMVAASVKNGATASALEWAGKQSDSLSALISSFNAPNTTPSVCTEVCSITAATSSMFDARSPGAYAVIKRAVAQGQWMQSAFESLDFRQSFPFFALARVIPRDIHNNKDDMLVLSACLYDCVVECATIGCSREMGREIKRGLLELTHSSVVEAHQLFVDLFHATANLTSREADKVRLVLTQKIKDNSFATCLLHSAVYLGMDEIVESITRLSESAGCTKAIFVDSLATTASAARSSRVVAILNEHGVDFDVTCALVAAERGNASVLRAIMQTRPTVSARVGEAALLSMHAPTIEVALINGCYDTPERHGKAKRILGLWDEDRVIKRRRVLPRSFSKATRSILGVDPRA